MTHIGDPHCPWGSHANGDPASWDTRPLVNFLRRKHGPEGRACSHTVLPRPWRPSWRLPGWTVKLPGTGDAHLLRLSPFGHQNVCNRHIPEACGTSAVKGKDFALGGIGLKVSPIPD